MDEPRVDVDRDLPRSLVVLGGGASGVEMASMFARFGVDVALVHSLATART